jgi:hypothetical protein
MTEEINKTKKEKRPMMPTSDLDLQMLTINPTYMSSHELNSDFIEKLQKYYSKLNPQTGVTSIEIEKLWNTHMGYFTRDLRLSNLKDTSMNPELKEVRHYLDLAGDCLSEGYIKGFLAAMRRVAALTESSQGRGGFLRKRLTTLTEEHYKEEIEPPKKSLFGMGKKEKEF